MTSWRRNTSTSYDLDNGYFWNDAIAAGNTYLRCHIRWGFQVDMPLENDIQAVATNLVSFGLVTTIGDGTELPPLARSGAADVDPPTQRWIYWETLAPRLVAIDEAAGVMVFGASASTETTQTRGQVLATGLPAGDTLNLFASWESAFAWEGFNYANVMFWHSVSILRKV